LSWSFCVKYNPQFPHQHFSTSTIYLFSNLVMTLPTHGICCSSGQEQHLSTVCGWCLGASLYAIFYLILKLFRHRYNLTDTWPHYYFDKHTIEDEFVIKWLQSFFQFVYPILQFLNFGGFRGIKLSLGCYILT
jgi:hypothetical protein